ncbi:hypothetical protein LX36DRAFT_709113 [Colletotrichum falcatum]|nr:hypothetical protein LX36DRAFT_709113 [Colletotrichum falcatum]
MPRHREVTKSSPPAVVPKKHTPRQAVAETKPGAKGEVAGSQDVKKKAKADKTPVKSEKAEKAEKPEKTTKRKVAPKATISPLAKRQKTTATKQTKSDAKPTTSKPATSNTPDSASLLGAWDFGTYINPNTPKKTAAAAQESSKPRLHTFPETPKAPNRHTTEDESESDLEPQSMAIHSSGNRRLKAEITRLKSQIQKPQDTQAAHSGINKDKDEDKDLCGLDHAKLGQVSKSHILVAKEDYSTLMSRAATVNKMVMTFIKSVGAIEDTNIDENPTLTNLLAEARSLSFGVQSLTNAINKAFVAEKNGLAAVNEVAKHTGGVFVSEKLPLKKTGDSEEETGAELPKPTKKIFLKVRK